LNQFLGQPRAKFEVATGTVDKDLGGSAMFEAILAESIEKRLVPVLDVTGP
jgi:hypothetical protein